MKSLNLIFLSLLFFSLIGCEKSSEIEIEKQKDTEKVSELAEEQEVVRKNYFKVDKKGQLQELIVNLPVGNKKFKVEKTIPIVSKDKTKSGFIIVVNDGKGGRLDGKKENLQVKITEQLPVSLENTEMLQIFYYNDDLSDRDSSFVTGFMEFLEKNPIGDYTADRIQSIFIGAKDDEPKQIGGGIGIPRLKP